MIQGQDDQRPSANDDPDSQRSRCLWAGLTARLDQWRSDWRTVVEGSGATRDPSIVVGPPARSNAAIFEAFAIAFLSGNTRSDRIAALRDALAVPFQGFDPRRFAALSDTAIEREVVAWFTSRRAGAAGLRTGLLRLRAAASRLTSDRTAESAQLYLRHALDASDGSPEGLAVTLGTSPAWKLPGFGLALSAEALRLLGLDLCKPDRHVLRAAGAWELVTFRRWQRRGDFTPPQADPAETLAAMHAVRSFADANAIGVSYATSAIWTAGAVSGARLTNQAFAAIAAGCPPSRRSPPPPSRQLSD